MSDLLKDITPLPWQIRDGYSLDGRMAVVGDVDGDTHADGSTTYTYDTITTGLDDFDEACDSAEANARYIVQACNAYPDLVEALEMAKDAIFILSGPETELHIGGRDYTGQQIWDKLSAALAKGEQS